MNRFIIILIGLLLIAGLSAEEMLLDIMFTNDIHGGIDAYPATFMNPQFPPTLGGGASAATYIEFVREKTDQKQRDNLLIDAGDFFQGHPVGTMTDGKAVIKYMNDVGYDLTVIGNHEYDIGEERLIDTYKLAEFPILSCNIVKKGTDELVDYATPYIIIEKLGVKMGIIGVTTTDTKMMSFPDNVKNVDFINAKEALEKYIKIVHEKDVDIVIVVGHMGLPYEPEPTYQKRYLNGNQNKERYWGYDAQELAHEVEGIDIFFGGHMHKGFNEPWEDPVTHTLVMQGWAYGSGIGHVTIKIDEETKTVSGYEMPAIREGILVTLFQEEFIPDEEINEMILEEQAIAEKGMDEVIGEAAVNLTRSGSGAQNLAGNFVCDAMLSETGADFSFLNLGGIRAEIQQGPILYRDIFNVMPFDNQVVIFEASGEFLKEIIEMRVSGSHHGLLVSGVEVVYNKRRLNYDRVTLLKVGGENIKADKIYTIATTDFLMQGNAGLALLTKVPEDDITRPELGLRDVIADYVRHNSPVSSQIDNRWKRDDSAEISPELNEEIFN